MIDLSRFTDKEELFDHLHKNKSFLISQKKSVCKEADSVHYFGVYKDNDKSDISNKNSLSVNDMLTLDKVRVKSVINTTNILDSHNDVHLPNLWDKTLKEQSVFYLVKEHIFNFDNVISDNVSAYTKMMTWKELGYDREGKTQALIFDSILQKGDNPSMFERYVKGKVRNHSVAMQYVKLFLAINSDDQEYKEEKEVWDRYINQVVNYEEALDSGYFWAVTEAKIIEGSAVTRGSNFITPTQSVSEINNEPSADTQSKNSIEPGVPLDHGIFNSIGRKIKI